MKQYLKSPFVIIGALGIGYYLWKSKSTKKKAVKKKATPKLPSEKQGLDEQSSFVQENVKEVAKANNVPTKLVMDVAKMDIKKLARNILVNQRMLNRKKMSNDERNHILSMIDYMEKELESRQDDND
tara:strand:- start:3111 stop:3491 length:381 start_codon:yes stop_codon:yes gene_type:complete